MLLMTTDDRPDPDALLARVQQEEDQGRHGRLKVFFGAAAGVGKTYAMLSEAQDLLASGVDVVAGYIETHGRKETEELLAGIPQLPLREIEYRGVKLREFDIDAALARKPAVLLVDELAHTNAPGSRHAKRWQDVQELVDAGITVHTTLNVQHLESLNDVVAQITGTIVRETVPDSVIEQADEIELIDLSAEELQQRLKEGKVYVSDQAGRAVHNFFRKGNLMALRELALRRTAERVDAQMQRYKQEHDIERVWPAGERLLVCIGPGPLSSRIVRTAARMAGAMRSEWIALYVESRGHDRMSEAERERIAEALRLAEKLGGDSVTVQGDDAADEILAYARSRNVNRIIVGKPIHARWKEKLFGSVVDDLINRSGDVDVYIITGEGEEAPLEREAGPALARNWRGYAAALGLAALCSAFAWLLDPILGDANIAMIFLVGVLIAAVLFGRGPAILSAVLNVLIFDFFFIAPRGTFVVDDTQYVVTFAAMLAVGIVVSTLLERIRQQIGASRQRERRTAALYSLSHDLAATRGRDAIAQVATRHTADVFEGKAVVMMAIEGGLSAMAGGQYGFDLNDAERGVARWAFDHASRAGLGTDTLPGAEAIYLPLMASRGAVGVLGVKPNNPKRLNEPEQMHLLETFADQIALAVDRTLLADEAQAAQVRAEAEQVRNTLLSSVSHDLRTPLASITGAASAMLDADASLDATAQRELAESIYEEAERLNTLVRNLLDMTRLESGAMTINAEPQPLEEVIGYVLDRMERQLHDRDVRTAVPDDLPLIPMDSVLVSQVFVNLLENGLKYTPAGAPIEISARRDAQNNVVLVEVADRGPGLPAGEEARVFDKFHRAASGAADGATTTTGAGLGLAICRAIVNAHGGRIWAENRDGGGASFKFTLPLAEPSPLGGEGRVREH